MPISFTCPHCGRRTDVAERFSGQSGRCVECAKEITIPASNSTEPKSTAGRRRPIFGLVLVAVVVLLIGGAVIVALTWFAISPNAASLLPGSKSATNCAKNMTQIAAAVAAYVKDHGCYPPAYTVDADGKPLHSWRVLILPYLGYADLYDQIDLESAWDSPTNASLAKRIPREYQCPADADVATTETSYFGIGGGKQYFFDQDKQRNLAELRDGSALTVMIVEATGMGVNWMQPIDIDAAEFIRWNAYSYRGAGSLHTDRRFHVITADGQVHALHQAVNSDELHALVTIAGGELVYPAFEAP